MHFVATIRTQCWLRDGAAEGATIDILQV